MIFNPGNFSEANFHTFSCFFSGRPSWKIAIFSGSAIYMAERHFSHLVYHLPIGLKHISTSSSHLSHSPYGFSTHFSNHSLEITLPLLTKPISHPPAHEFRETKKIFQSASEYFQPLGVQSRKPNRPKMNFERSNKNLSTRPRVNHCKTIFEVLGPI